jgi:hypothetical protein
MTHRNYIRLITLTIAAHVAVMHVASHAIADGNPPRGQQPPQGATTRQYNDRLPPVMPGEEIVTETGQRMRVWSSAGPVPVNPQPTPQPLPGGVGGGGVGVILDGRDRYDHGRPDGAPVGQMPRR